MELRKEIVFPPFRLDLANEQLWREEQLVALRPKTFAILRYLAEYPGRLVTKDELLQAVWGDTLISEEGLRDYLREIRQALGDDANTPRFVETVRGRGYRFLPAVTPQPVQSSRFQVPNLEPQSSGLITQHSALVGRDADLAYLHERLEKTLRDERQQVFVTGEPGIGKTTLLEAFRQELETRDWGLVPAPQASSLKPLASGVWLGWGQCIEQHGAGEAFLPILDALGRLCRGPGGERLLAILRKQAPMWVVQFPAFVEREELEALQWKVQGASRERMLREMAEALEVLTTDRPLVLVLEDLHWSDISTLDLLAFIARRKESARLMIVGSYRPVEMLNEGHPLKGIVLELYGHQLAEELPLKVLSETDIEAYLATRFSLPSPFKGEGQGEGNERIPHLNLARTRHQRTGGNPLFLVSTVNDLVARDVFTQSGTSWTLPSEAKDVGISDSIRHLVESQSRRLSSEEQHLLEAASVAGTEFAAAAVAAALEDETVVVEQRCERLAGRQHFLRRIGVEAWPDGTLAARYSFLHALYQQLWHERVTPTQLQHYHLQIGRRKEQAYGERVREIAAELAVHFEQARDYEKAVRYLQQAGQNAIQRSANIEAISHFIKGLELLKTLPDTSERAQKELALQVALGTPLMLTKGWGAPEVAQVYTRARDLCRRVGETPELFPVLRGVWAFHFLGAELRTARELGEQLLDLAQSAQDPALLVEAHRALGETVYLMGELAMARWHLECGLTLYDPQQHHALALQYGHDPGMACRCYMAFVLWMLGYPDQALEQSQRAVVLARELSHSFSVGYALTNAAWLHQYRRDGRAAREQAEAVITLAREQEFALLLSLGTLFRGWALMAQEEAKAALDQIRQGLAALRATGAEVTMPYFLGLQAEACGEVGQIEKGLSMLAEALAIAHENEERYYEAELYRLKGQLTLQKAVSSKQKAVPSPQPLTPSTQIEAEACFLKAIDVAQRQQAKSLELRATVSLARLWQQQGKRHEARQILSPVYNWFTEGFDTMDLQEAKALLGELGQ